MSYSTTTVVARAKALRNQIVGELKVSGMDATESISSMHYLQVLVGDESNYVTIAEKVDGHGFGRIRNTGKLEVRFSRLFTVRKPHRTLAETVSKLPRRVADELIARNKLLLEEAAREKEKNLLEQQLTKKYNALCEDFPTYNLHLCLDRGSLLGRIELRVRLTPEHLREFLLQLPKVGPPND